MTRSREVSKGATRVEYVYTATSQQTTFSGNDDNSNSLSYTAGQIDVFVNGVRQAAADYTATNGTSVVLGAGASAGDTVNINAFGTFSVADVIVDRLEFDYTATAGQTTFTGSDNDSQTMAYTAGRIDVYLNGSRLNVTDDYTATNGTSVVLAAGAQAGDSLVVVAHGTVNLASNILSGDLDLNGNELILDADQDTTITADTDDQIDIKIGGADDFAFKANKFEVQTGSNIDMNGTELILDADGDTSITADTDDQIDIRVGGSDVIAIGSKMTGSAVTGKQSMWIPAAAMYPNTTNGCADLTQVELSNGPELKVLDFDASSDENAQFTVAFPKAWNAGTVTFQAFFTVTGTNTGTVAWGLSAVAFADNGDQNTAFGTNVVATAKAHSGTSNDLDVANESGAVTIAGSPGDNELVYFQIMRDVSADNQSGDARLLGIKLFFTTDALTDD